MSRIRARAGILACAVFVASVSSGLVLADEPPETAASGAGETTGQVVSAPEIILSSQKAPDFPPAAKAGRFSGTVTVEATILESGEVGKVEVVGCSRPNLGFEEATVDAVKQWRFEPATEDGEPVEFLLKFRLNFRGDGRAPLVTAASYNSPDSRDRSQGSTDAAAVSPTPSAPK